VEDGGFVNAMQLHAKQPFCLKNGGFRALMLYRLSYLGTANEICLVEGLILVKAFLDSTHVPEGMLKNGPGRDRSRV
jgi:hypothetical protein